MRLSHFVFSGMTALFILAAGVSQSHALTVEELKQRGFVTIGISDQNPPYASLDASMENTGLEVDLAKGLATALGVEMRPVVVTSANRVACLLTGCADILIHSLTITPERQKQVDFSVPYAENVFGIVAAQGTELKTIDDLAKYRVGVIRAAFGDPILTEKAPAGTTIQRYEDLSGLLQALLSGQVDAIAENSLVPGVLNRMQPAGNFENKVRFTAGYWGMAIQKGQPELLAFLNSYLTTIRTDGTLDGLYKSYMNVAMPVLPTN